MSRPDLTGRTAIVTGSRRGIGAAIVRELLDHGATVVVCGRGEAGVADLVRTLDTTAPGRVRGCAADLTTAHGREHLLETAATVDILVNNAGGFTRVMDTLSATLDEWNDQLAVNLTVPFLLCQAVLPAMIERGWGRIVNIGSIVASAPQLGNAIGYAAAKAGLAGFTRQLAAEVAHTGVTANVVNPGTIGTEHLRDYLAVSDRMTEQSLAGRIPVGRLGRPAEIAGVIPYLVSDAGAFITGAVLDINGGAIHA